MPPGVNWTEDAVRVLLQYLINNHGNVASFHPTALAQLRPQLQNHLDQASYTSMTGFKIRDKFGHMWRLAVSQIQVPLPLHLQSFANKYVHRNPPPSLVTLGFCGSSASFGLIMLSWSTNSSLSMVSLA